MAAISYFESLNRIQSGKGQFPFTFLYGFNESLGENIVQALVAQTIEKKSDFNYRRFYLESGSEHSWEEIINEANSSSFFIESRKILIVMIRETRKLTIDKASKDLLKKYIQSPNMNSTLIMYLSLNTMKDDFKQLKKQKITGLLKDLASPHTLAVDLDNIYEREVKQYIKSYLKQRNITITPAAVDKILDMKGDDLASIINQMTKFEIADIAGEERVLDADDVDWVITGIESHSIWDLTEAIETENVPKYLKVLQYLFINGIKPAFIIGTLITYYNKIFTAKFLMKQKYSPAEIGKALQQPSFILDKFIRSVRNFSKIRLLAILDIIYKLDYESKTASEDSARVSLQNFIFQVKLLDT